MNSVRHLASQHSDLEDIRIHDRDHRWQPQLSRISIPPKRLQPSETKMLSLVRPAGNATQAIAISIAVSIVTLTCLVTSVPRAEPADIQSTLEKAVPDHPCRVNAPAFTERWTQVDHWAWKEICEGRDANFTLPLGKKFTPTAQDEWEETLTHHRTLSPGFLETILLREPYRSLIPYRGVRINGAIFDHPVDLQNGKLGRPLILANSLFRSSVDMNRIMTSSAISLQGSRFTDFLNLQEMTVGQSLLLQNAEFNKVDLKSARIDRQVSLAGSKFDGPVNMQAISAGNIVLASGVFSDLDMKGSNIKGHLILDKTIFRGKLDMEVVSVGGSVAMRSAKFASVGMSGIAVGHQMSMDKSTFDGKLDLDSASIAGSLVMGKHSTFASVNMRATSIGGQLSMSESKFRGKLDMDTTSVRSSAILRKSIFSQVNMSGVTIGGQLTMIGARSSGPLILDTVDVEGGMLMRNADVSEVRMMFSDIRRILDLRGALLGKLNLTGTQIKGDLVLGSPKASVQWREHEEDTQMLATPRLILRNTTASALQDTEDSWPDALELEGFVYRRLGGLQANENNLPHQRGSAWYIDWLARDPTFSPQPYRHLARIVNSSGHMGIANDILFESRERELGEAEPSEYNWWKLGALRITIGYGYGQRYFWVLGWVVLFVLVGTFILRGTDECYENGEKLGLWYSLDMLLPVIKLRESRYEIDLSHNAARYYFFGHKIVGYLLVFFVVAGLTRLTE